MNSLYVKKAFKGNKIGIERKNGYYFGFTPSYSTSLGI